MKHATEMRRITNQKKENDYQTFIKKNNEMFDNFESMIKNAAENGKSEVTITLTNEQQQKYNYIDKFFTSFGYLIIATLNDDNKLELSIAW